ncbi:rod shape-determining protein MreC [Thiomicrorhabdus aquaedulcis]|uniref:rod shape-determining protein MreC n=1 Tax=Thiomicrorhabdus aquaedulcis TaxID=2211106 RepID=UPI000FD8069B|nr:rod shape-determining protein MreC [Thiomicrorhabdus aquaedulcis]
MHLIIAFILAILLMIADHYGNLTSSFRSILLTTLNPIERLAATPNTFYTWVTTDFSSLDSLEIENQKLLTENLLLKAKLQQFNNLELEVARLESLLGTTGKMNNQAVQIATVTYYSNNPLSQFLSVNKGQLDNITSQQTVIDAEGILGQIVATTPTSSRVLLITDPDHQIPVRIQRTGQRGILAGTGHDLAQLNFIPKSSEIKVGDLIESSGLGGLFPAGYPVAKIINIEMFGDNPYYSITAKPLAQMHQTRKVLILTESVTKNNYKEPLTKESTSKDNSKAATNESLQLKPNAMPNQVENHVR